MQLRPPKYSFVYRVIKREWRGVLTTLTRYKMSIPRRTKVVLRISRKQCIVTDLYMDDLSTELDFHWKSATTHETLEYVHLCALCSGVFMC